MVVADQAFLAGLVDQEGHAYQVVEVVQAGQIQVVQEEEADQVGHQCQVAREEVLVPQVGQPWRRGEVPSVVDEAAVKVKLYYVMFSARLILICV